MEGTSVQGRIDAFRKNSMNSNHYEEKKEFRIYAILLRAEENYVYVGKTTGRRISAVYSRHTTGGVKATEGYFDQGETLEFYLLEELQVTTSTAYKHIVAWCHIFQRAGYAGINHEKTLSQAENLLPETRAIVESHSQKPLEQILQCTRLENPASADKTVEKKTRFEVADHTPDESIQMNIRISLLIFLCNFYNHYYHYQINRTVQKVLLSF